MKIFDLAQRTSIFGMSIIQFCKQVPQHAIAAPLTNQLIRSGTSVGANYCEADDAESRKDFIHKLSICKKEAREVTYWLRMMRIACPERTDEAKKLENEARELNLIFNAIINKTRKNQSLTSTPH